jgi:roadblock/LC7 domain-containing protein
MRGIDEHSPRRYVDIGGTPDQSSVAMAISARLSRTLRESLGEESADDLVNWMVQVEGNRSELHGVMEAWKVTTDSRFTEFGARMDLRFAEMDARFSTMDARFSTMDARFSTMDARFSEQQRWMEARFAEQQQEMRLGFATLETRFERRFGDLIKWSFVFWCGAIGAVAMLARALK